MRAIACLVVILAASAFTAYAGPIDPVECFDDRTLTAEIEHAEAAILVERISAAIPKDAPGPTTFRVLEILKDTRGLTEVGREIRVDFRARGERGETGLLLGWESNAWHWYSPEPISRNGFAYVRNLPAGRAPVAERLTYFREFLGDSDPTVAADAFLEFQEALIPVAAALIDKESRSRLRGLLIQETVPPERRGFFAELLGLSGTDADRQLLRDLALRQTTDYRIEAAGVMSGFVALAGEQGLNELEQHKLMHPGVIFAERYGVFQAIRFCHDNVPDRIPRPRLGQTLQLFLNDSELADLAFLELGRIRDWTAIEDVSPMYESLAADDPFRNILLRSMIRYLRAAVEEPHDVATAPTTEQRERATALLAMFNERETDQYQKALRFFSLRRKGRS